MELEENFSRRNFSPECDRMTKRKREGMRCLPNLQNNERGDRRQSEETTEDETRGDLREGIRTTKANDDERNKALERFNHDSMQSALCDKYRLYSFRNSDRFDEFDSPENDVVVGSALAVWSEHFIGVRS
jgi:hypothetical protein